MKNNINRKIIYLIIFIFALCLSLGISLAYFVVEVIGNEDAKDIVVETSNLLLNYKEGNILDVNGVFPGNTFTKEFTVENAGSGSTTFNIGLTDVNNTFINDELVVSINCTSYDIATNEVSGTCPSYEQKVLPITDSVLYNNIQIDKGKKYVYAFTITFIETNSSQNYNQGAKFKAKINVTE